MLGRGRRRRRAPGVEARYSNLGYLALGEIVSAASGESFEDTVRRNLLEPLGMTSTDFLYTEALAEHAATGYQLRRSPMTPLFRLMLPRGIVGGRSGRFVSFNRICVDGPSYGGLIGSAEDAARFSPSTPAVAAASSRRKACARCRSSRCTVPSSTSASAGSAAARTGISGAVRRAPRRGRGFFNMMRLFTGRSLGVIVMGNATAYDHQRIAKAVLEACPG